MRSVQTDRSAQAHRARTSPAGLAPQGTGAGCGSVGLSFTHPPSCAPLLHARYRHFIARMGATDSCVALRHLRTGLPTSRTCPSDHSVSTHLTVPCRRFDTLPISATGFPLWVWASPFASRLAGPARPNRVRHPTDWSFTSCCSPPRLTATQLRSVTGPESDRPGEDFHLFDIVRSRAHRMATGRGLGPPLLVAADFFKNFLISVLSDLLVWLTS